MGLRQPAGTRAFGSSSLCGSCQVHAAQAPRELRAPFRRSAVPSDDNKPDFFDDPLLTEGSHGESNSVTERSKIVSRPSDLVQGTLDMLILKILALEPLNGWAINQRLKQISSEVLGVSDGSLYPALHKLERRGWVRAQWNPSENNRRAKFYSLTRLGRKQLDKETASWNRISAAISGIVQLKEA